MGIILYPSQSDHEPSSTAGVYFCSPTNRFIVRSYVAANVSKYGGKFLDEKNVMKLKEAKVKAFTLIEMLVVLLIISVLLLLFVPNLTKQKDAVNDKGKAAVVKVVESQAELYSLDKNEDASLSKLQADGRITAEQAKAYKEYHAKQKTSQTVAD